MKYEIKNETKRMSSIQSSIGFTLALCILILFGVFDVRKFGIEIDAGFETVMFWIIRVICILLIPLFIFILIKVFKQLFRNELLFRASKDGIFAKITDKHIYNVNYIDIEKVTYKTYPHGVYILFIFLKEPSKYLDKEQIIRMENARKSIPESGDIGISSLIIKEKLEVVLETINYYLNNLNKD